MTEKNKKEKTPIWLKSNLTIDEAADYFNIGTAKIREITNEDSCPFVLWIGSKRLIKRRLFEQFLEKQFSL
jgi:excisionase family DNA binding protein